MGFDILGGLTGGLKGSLNTTSPSDFLGAAGNISTTGFATNLLGGAASGAMRGLLGMDTTPCPPGASKGGNNGPGSGNDPCGRNDNPLKSALLGLGMAAAGPAIAQAGAALGGFMDTGMGALSNAIGSGMSAATSGIAGSTGLNPSIVSGSLGAGVSAVAGGASGSGSTIAALTGATSATSALNSSTSTSSSYSSGASSASSFLASAKSKVSSFF